MPGEKGRPEDEMRYLGLIMALMVGAQIVSAQEKAAAATLHLSAAPVSALAPAPPVSVIATVPEQDHGKRTWMISVAAMIAGTSMDAASSWGKREGNSLLASSNGNFGARGLSLKAGMAAAILTPQILFRNRRELRGKFALANFVEAGMYGGIAVHNLRVR